MPDLWLVLVAIIMSVGVLAFIFMLFVWYSSKDDANTAWFPRIVCIFALFLACMAVLALPFDVSVHARQDKGELGSQGIDMQAVWDIILISVAVFMIAIIPFAIFFYESEQNPEEQQSCMSSQGCLALMYTSCFVGIFATILMILYFVDNKARIPFENRTYDYDWISNNVQIDVATSGSYTIGSVACTAANCEKSDDELTIEMTPTVFIIAVASLIGWFLFCVFSGVGLVSLPFGLINSWRTRPKPIDRDEYKSRKGEIAELATNLKKEGEELQKSELKYMAHKPSRREKANHKKDTTRFENSVYLLKQDLRVLNISYNLKGGNPCIPFGKFMIGIIGSVISLMWLLHICIFILPDPPVDPFLNNLFIGMSLPGFNLFGVVAFGIQVFWLFLCVINGAFNFGLRIPLLFRLYPMEVGNTLLNAFLVNSWLLLVCSIPTVHFCVTAFPVYTRETQVDLLFGSQIKYITFFGAFFQNNVFEIAMLCFSFLALIYLCACATSQEKLVEKQIELLSSKRRPGESMKVSV